MLCECGYKIVKKKGRPIGTNAKAGFKVSSGRRVGTTADTGYGVSTGRTVGTTEEAGFHVSCGRPVIYRKPKGLLTQNDKQIERYDTDEGCLSLTDELLAKAKKCIEQQKRFDSKPLAIGMCYCCGSILWSRVDNSHTNLVDINLTEEQIPAVAYQEALSTAGKGLLEYRHKSGKLYACAVCKTFKCPSDYKFHIGYLDEKLPIKEWKMTFPEVILNLKNPINSVR